MFCLYLTLFILIPEKHDADKQQKSDGYFDQVAVQERHPAIEDLSVGSSVPEMQHKEDHLAQKHQNQTGLDLVLQHHNARQKVDDLESENQIHASDQ